MKSTQAKRGNTLLSGLAGLAMALAAGSSQAYVIGGPANTGSSSYGWTGPANEDLREALENPNFFGPGGVIEESVTTTDISFPSADPFAGVDGFISPWWFESVSGPYEQAVVDFFLGGGDLWLLQDSQTEDGIGDLLGVPTVGQTAITPVNGTAPLFDGPFGVANDVEQGGGLEGYVSEQDVLDANGTVIGRNTENQVIAAFWGADQYAPGAGALIIVPDIDMFTTRATFGPELSDLDDNARFALNAFAFLATSDAPIDEGPNPVPLPGTLALVALGLLTLRKRQR